MSTQNRPLIHRVDLLTHRREFVVTVHAQPKNRWRLRLSLWLAKQAARLGRFDIAIQ